jgi:predicted molibdopterin-dependent oxidoreductase YjgC
VTPVPITITRRVELTIDDQTVSVPEGTTILQACREQGTEIPTLCYGPTIAPKNACRVCMVEVEGSRTLVPSCSRPVEAGMVVRTSTARTSHSRRLVLELLGSSVDLSITPNVDRWNVEYGADPARFGEPAAPRTDRDHAVTGHHHVTDGHHAETVHQPVKVDNELYVRDYSKCILCYQCVDACGEQWQNTFAIGVAGRGFDARISTEYDVELADSACVYCGNCIQVCPTGALMFTSEHERRAAGTWDEDRQTQTTTVCPYCGVGCNLTLHVQDNTILKVTSPADHPITHGNLCIKGRFGFQHVQNRPD